MGRPSFLPADCNEKVKLRLVEVKLSSGGYDSGGAYWGARSNGLRLYWSESVEHFVIIDYVEQTRSGNIEMAVEATNRATAKNAIREILPNATFY